MYAVVYLSRSLGLSISSSANPIRMNESDSAAMQSPGGIAQYHVVKAPVAMLPDIEYSYSILPQDITSCGPSPRKLRAASVTIAPGTDIAIVM